MPPTTEPTRSTIVERLLVDDVMHPDIIACAPTATLAEVAEVMARHRVHCVLVTGSLSETPSEHPVWGVVSDADIVAAGIDAAGVDTAATLAGSPVVSAVPGTPLADAGRRMLQHHTSHVVVVDPDTHEALGVLSTLDIVSALAGGEDESA
jgi:CBS domain-containing protein